MTIVRFAAPVDTDKLRDSVKSQGRRYYDPTIEEVLK
jgi:hypothetical protein